MEKKTFGLIILTIIVSLGYSYAGDESPDLYLATDDVIRLNSTTFIPTVFHQNKNITYMVQFYNTFCGHCQMFAPVYKLLATRIKNWTSVVRIAGVDCSKDENIITCSENQIKGYPTIFIYPPNAQVQNPKDAPLDLRKLNIEWNIDDIEETLINYIANLTQTDREYPLVVHALEPINVTSLNDIHRIYPPPQNERISDPQHNVQDFMLLVEKEKSYLGRRLIIEYSRISTKLELRRVQSSNKALLESILPSEVFSKLEDNIPILIKINSLRPTVGTEAAQILVRGEEKNVLQTIQEPERQDFIQEKFKLFLDHFYSEELKEFDDSFELKSKLRNQPKKLVSEDNNDISSKHDEELEIQYLVQHDPIGSQRIFAIDILKGISYMITHEIKIKGDLSPIEFTTIRNLLTILKKFLPLEEWDTSVSKFIEDLRTRLDSNRLVYEQNGLSSQEVADMLDLSGGDAIRLRYGRENWVACLESDRQHKGYTCSLWLLFHSLTVGEYNKAAPVRFRPTMVLFTMRDYITKFLGCTVCSSNFKKETELLETSLEGRNSSVLWLWYAHNRINQRLNEEKQTGKKPLVDVIFPSPNRCPNCIKTSIKEIGVDGKSLVDIEWDQTSVLSYLISLYRPDKVVSPKETAALLRSIKSKVNYDLLDMSNNLGSASHRRVSPAGADMNRSIEQWNIQSLFSTSDISLCLFLYLCCIVMVAIVCVALNPKWTRCKTR